MSTTSRVSDNREQNHGSAARREQGGLRVGVARRDISPPQPALLMPTGMVRLIPTRGVLDELYVEALAIECGGRLAFVATSDLRTLAYPWVREIRETLAARTGCDPRMVLLSSVHNHCSSPEAADQSPPALAAEAEADRRIVDAFIAACLEARDQMRPAELCATTARLKEPVGENRRMRLSNGTCVNRWGSGAVPPWGHKYAGPPGPHDPEIQLLAIREVGQERPFAVLSCYASHPHLGAIPYFSGEFAGAAKREIQRRLPGLVAMHGSHTGGDVDLHCVHPLWPGGVEAEVEWFKASAALLGGRFADAVVPAVEKCRRYARPKKMSHAYWSMGEDDGPADEVRQIILVSVLRLGPLALVSMPGEMFVNFGLELRRRSPLKLLMIGYNGTMTGYVPPALAFEQGSYEVMRGPAPSMQEAVTVTATGARTVRASRDTGVQVTARILELVNQLADGKSEVK